MDPKSKTYGYITTTPKPNWANVDVVGALKKRVDVPIYFTTDVNSSAYGEVYARNNRGENIETLVYYTIWYWYWSRCDSTVVNLSEELAILKWGMFM